MANSLLDFVMSLVRDPDAAARYAENPDQAIFDANLTNAAFGGPQRRTLYLTGAGSVWSIELDVAGLPY